MSTTLPLFWHLSSANKKERIDASAKLVSALEHFQSNFVPKPATPETSEDEDEGKTSDGLDLLNAQDVSYSIRRLIRGLASPRESSRLGFAVALTEVRAHILVCVLHCKAIHPTATLTGGHGDLLPNCPNSFGLLQNTRLYDRPRRT